MDAPALLQVWIAALVRALADFETESIL